jgi:hypothetical protein
MFGSSKDTHKLDAWRRAEQLVCERWREYVGAEQRVRPGAYAAYATALAAEELAARRLAGAQPADLSEAA